MALGLTYTSGAVRIYEGEDAGQWEIVEEYVCPASEVYTWVQLLPGTEHTGLAPGGKAPVCETVQADRRGMPAGKALVRARYVTERVVGRATVELDYAVDPVPLTVDLDGRVLDGIDIAEWEAGRLCRHVVTRGNPFDAATRCLMRVKTAFHGELEARRIMNLAGRVNRDRLETLEADPGVLRLLGPRFSRVYKRRALWYADYVFLRDPEGHNEAVRWERRVTVPVAMAPLVWDEGEGAYLEDSEAEPVTIAVRELPGYLERSEDEAGSWRHVVDTEETPPARVAREADFSDLDGMVVWDEEAD